MHPVVVGNEPGDEVVVGRPPPPPGGRLVVLGIGTGGPLIEKQ